MPPKAPAPKPQGSVPAFLRLTGSRFICIRSGFLRNVRRIIEVAPTSISILGLDLQPQTVFPLEDVLEVQVTGDTSNQLCIRTKSGSETFYCESRARLLAALYAVLRSHLKEARAPYEVSLRFPHSSSATPASLSVNDWGILDVSDSKNTERKLLPQQTIIPFFSIAYLCPLSDQQRDFGIICSNGARVIVSCENRHSLLAHINENTFQRLGFAIQNETLTLSHFLATHAPPESENASGLLWPSNNGLLPYIANVQRHFVSHWGNTVDDTCTLRLAAHSDGLREMSEMHVVSFIPWDSVECFVKMWGSATIFGIKVFEGQCLLWSAEPDCDTFLINCMSIYKNAVRWSQSGFPRLNCEDTSFDRYIWGGPGGCDVELEEGLMKRVVVLSDKMTHECESVIIDYYANVFHPGDPSKDRSLSRTIVRILLHETQRGLKDPFLYQIAQLAARLFQKKSHFEEASSYQALTDVVAYGLSSNEQLLTWAISEILLAACCSPDGSQNKAELANRSSLLPGTSMDALTSILAHPQLHQRHLSTSAVLHLLDLLVSSRAENTPFDVNRSMLQRFRTLRRRIYNLTRSPVLITSISAARLLIVVLQGSHPEDVSRIQNECRDDTTLLWHLLLCLDGHPDQRAASMSLLELFFHENASCMSLLNRILPATIPLGLKEKWVEASSAVLRLKSHRSTAADNSFSREVTLNWVKFFEYLNGDYSRPDLIWNSTTRGELVAALKRQLEIFAQAEVSGNRQITWNHSEFEVTYSSLADKIRVGRFYIELLLVDDTPVAAFDGVVRLLGGLFLRLLTSSVEKERSVCLRVMTKLYRTSNQEPLDPHALNCVVNLLRVLPSGLQLQAMEFFHVALQHPGNARNFVSFGGIMEILTIITLSHVKEPRDDSVSSCSSPALPSTPRTRRASISINDDDALLFSVVKVMTTICAVQPAVCSLGRPIRPIPAVRRLIFETNHILLLTDILGSRTSRIVKATLELIQEAIIGHSTQTLDAAFATAGTIPSLLALAASPDDAIALCASQILFNSFFNSDGKIVSNNSGSELFKWIPDWLAWLLSTEGPIKFAEILRGGMKSPRCVWTQNDTSILLDVCATLHVPERPISIEYTQSMMFVSSQKELGGYFVSLLASDWKEIDPAGHVFDWSSKDPVDMLQCVISRFSGSDAVESVELHLVLHKCIKLFCHTPAFASWPSCQEVLVISFAALLHHYSFVNLRPESKTIFHYAASCLDLASNSSSENALMMCSVPAPTNFDALSCCFRAICCGIIRSLTVQPGEVLNIASFCSRLSTSSCTDDIPLILSSISYCCSVAKFFGAEINVFVPQLLYHYIPLILLSSHDSVVVTACCQLLLILSPMINTAAFDLNCGLVEILLLKILHLNLSSPHLALSSQALLQLCSDHQTLFSVCIRYIPGSIIPPDSRKNPDNLDETMSAAVKSNSASSRQFCNNFFEDTLVPDCVWTEACRKELLAFILQRSMLLPSMLSHVSDDSVIRPVISHSDAKFMSSAQNKFTLVHGIYLELFVSDNKWVSPDSKSLLEQLLTQLSALYEGSDSPKSPETSRTPRVSSVSASSELVALLLRSVHRCLVNEDNLSIFKNVQVLSFLRKLFTDENSCDTTRMLILSLWDCVADDQKFCEYFVDSGLCASLIDQCFGIVSGSSNTSADKIAFLSKTLFVLTKCCRSSHVAAHLHRSGYLLFLIFVLLSSEPVMVSDGDACSSQSPFLEIANIASSAIFNLTSDKNRGNLIKLHLRNYFPVVFVEYMLLDPSGESERGDSGESIHDVSLLMAGFGQLTLAEAFWQKWNTPTLMWSPEDALALKSHCRHGYLEIQRQIKEHRMKKEEMPSWDPKGHKTDAVLYEETHLVAGVFLSALNSHPDLPLPNAPELMKQALIQLILVAQLKPIPLHSNLQPPKWDIDLAATIALVIRILSAPGVVLREESTAASRAIFSLEKALVQQHDSDDSVAAPLIIQCIRSLRLCATIAATTHVQSTHAALSRSELEPSPELEEAARFNATLISKIPSTREESTRYIHVILLQHAGLVNLLSAPALAGFRTSMTEWRLQLQPLQDASSVSMFKKVDRICRCFVQREKNSQNQS